MNKETRRCSECNLEFVPDLRVKDRQVTCGADGCQNARHKDRCKVWHQENPEARANHYQDVVKPFRERYPEYQRRWRWLREIREKLGQLLLELVACLQRVIARGQALDREGCGSAQVREKTVDTMKATLQNAVLFGELFQDLQAVASRLTPDAQQTQREIREEIASIQTSP